MYGTNSSAYLYYYHNVHKYDDDGYYLIGGDRSGGTSVSRYGTRQVVRDNMGHLMIDHLCETGIAVVANGLLVSLLYSQI